jgi:hypothetical protein
MLKYCAECDGPSRRRATIAVVELIPGVLRRVCPFCYATYYEPYGVSGEREQRKTPRAGSKVRESYGPRIR